MKEFRLTASPMETEWIYVPDVVYQESAGLTRRLQCVIPCRRAWQADDRYPVVLFIPGAAWQRQEMYNNLPHLTLLARRGYAVVSVQVREAALATYPAQLEDIRRAKDFLATLAADFHLDMERVVLAGDSSGAHLALMAALTGVCPVRGVIDLYGPTDMTLCGGPQSTSLLGLRDMRDDPEKAASASCCPSITPERDIPPILIAHGLMDDIVPPEHSRRLRDRLLSCGKSCVTLWVDGAGHGGPFWWSEPMLSAMDDFMTGLWQCVPDRNVP